MRCSARAPPWNRSAVAGPPLPCPLHSAPRLSLWSSVRSLLAESHDELDGVMRLGRVRAQVVDHVLDEEEPPAPRLLQARELRLEIGRLGLGDLLAAAV